MSQDQNITEFFNTDEAIEPFDFDYQNKFLKVFIEDKEFSERILDIVEISYFEEFQKLLLSRVLEFIEEYGQVYDYKDLRTFISDKETGVARDYLNGLLETIQGINNINIKRTKDRADEFFQKQNIRNALISGVKSWKSGHYEDIAESIKESLKKGQPKDSGHNYFMDIDIRMQKQYRAPVTMMPGLDKYFSGGLSGGELGIVMAPPGGGKSMMLVRMACEALRAGKKVAYYTLELSDKNVAQRFDACLTGVRLRSVWDFPDVIKEQLMDISQAGGDLRIKSYPTQTATVNTVAAHLKSLERNEGFVPDVIFVDYADIMRSTVRFEAKRDVLTHIYESLRALAIEFSIPVWTASQTNRTAMSSSDGRFGLETIGESIGKAATADVVIGVGRPDELRELGRAMINILKNRNGQDGFSIEAFFDTSRVYIELDLPNRAEAAVMVGANPQRRNNGPVVHERTIPAGQNDFNENINDILMKKRQEIEEQEITK